MWTNHSHDGGVVVSCQFNRCLGHSIARCCSTSKGMEIVFHMAFDELSDEDQLEAIDWLSQVGVTRILTRAANTTP